MHKLRKAVFLPPFLFLLVSAGLSIFFPERFHLTASGINDWILQHFDWLFSWGTFSFLIILLITYFSPIAKVRIGRAGAKPILTKWQWFSITLCTTIATGILFWGTAEPMYHMHEGPANMQGDTTFAMSSMFMHWSITPYGIYTLAGLVFALCYYNLKQPFAVSSLLFPLMGLGAHGPLGKVVDAVCLFALVAGMSASLGTGIMAISGGLEIFFGLQPGKLIYGLIGLVIVFAFVISASTGLKKGIRILSGINIRLFIVLAILIFILGPTREMLSIGLAGVGDYFQHFLPRSVGLDSDLPASWTRSWTVFYWANWLAWTPVTALFLGRLALGYTVRDFIHFNLFLPALFGGVWMIIFSGSTLHFDSLTSQPMYSAMITDGPQAVVYSLFEFLPMGAIISIFFLIIVFISYVTAADSNTSAMTGMSVEGINPENPEAPVQMKIIWGSLVGLVAWVMISYAGIDGVKMISNLGGFPALFLILLVGFGLLKLIWSGTDLN
ncbi:MAG: BCCT family transporter [Saprospiraceae bacterium]|nr:BCCT family transporter [Saprospiraceae bacterium]